jgi:formylglycine-generating enzyme
MKEVLKLGLILAMGPIFASAQRPGVSTTANMALIPGAMYEMGTDPADVPKLMEKFGVKRAELFAEESPKHRVTIGSFYLDRTEVTNTQFKRFVEQHPEWQKDKIAPGFHNGKYLQDWSGRSFPAGKEKYPVVFVNWYAASAYCQAQGKRLPSEAEWEFAARGGLQGKAFPWGDEMPGKTQANFSAGGLKAPTSVASYPANGYGLFDMAGNVWEFLADEWQKYTAKANRDTDFLQVKTRRVLRGGSFGGSPVNLRVTYRDSHSPENAVEHVGFRCGMSNPIQSEAVNELLRLHHQARASHFTRDGRSMVDGFAVGFTDVRNGTVNYPSRDASLTRFQNYLNNSTFIEWDDITPPTVRVSDDATMGYVIVHKKVRLKAKDENGAEREETEVFAWIAVYQKFNGAWKLAAVASTNTPAKE